MSLSPWGFLLAAAGNRNTNGALEVIPCGVYTAKLGFVDGKKISNRRLEGVD
jgi:hypothetical protein